MVTTRFLGSPFEKVDGSSGDYYLLVSYCTILLLLCIMIGGIAGVSVWGSHYYFDVLNFPFEGMW